MPSKTEGRSMYLDGIDVLGKPQLQRYRAASSQPRDVHKYTAHPIAASYKAARKLVSSTRNHWRYSSQSLACAAGRVSGRAPCRRLPRLYSLHQSCIVCRPDPLVTAETCELQQPASSMLEMPVQERADVVTAALPCEGLANNLMQVRQKWLVQTSHSRRH